MIRSSRTRMKNALLAGLSERDFSSVKLETRRIDTTLGELIAALSDAAFEVCSDENDAYLLVSLALEDIFLDDAFRRAVRALISANGTGSPPRIGICPVRGLRWWPAISRRRWESRPRG